MGFTTFFVASLLVAGGLAKPIPNPIEMMMAAGPEAGKVCTPSSCHKMTVNIWLETILTCPQQVITKCSAPGQIALAYDDGPYQYTQKLVDTLTAGGAKGTFFVTGTLYGRPGLNSKNSQVASIY